MKPDIKEALTRYVESGIPPGGFLRAVLENDLMKATEKADEINILTLHQICCYMYNNIPMACYGSPAKVATWLTEHRKKLLTKLVDPQEETEEIPV